MALFHRKGAKSMALFAFVMLQAENINSRDISFGVIRPYQGKNGRSTSLVQDTWGGLSDPLLACPHDLVGLLLCKPQCIINLCNDELMGCMMGIEEPDLGMNRTGGGSFRCASGRNRSPCHVASSIGSAAATAGTT